MLQVTIGRVAALLLLLQLSPVAAQSDYGISLRWPNHTCPGGSFYEGTSWQPNCCPDGTHAAPQGTEYCCPSADDCKLQVEANIKCADPSWVYYPSQNPANDPFGFCCLAGWVGYVQLNSTGGQQGLACGPPGYVLQKSQQSINSINIAAATVTVTGSSSATIGADGSSSSTTSAAASTNSGSTFSQATSYVIVTSTAAGSTSVVPATPSLASGPDSSVVANSANAKAALAGVGVGIAVFVLAICGGILGCYVFFTRKKRRSRGTDGGVYLQQIDQENPVKDSFRTTSRSASELDTLGPSVPGGRQELDNERQIHELQAVEYYGPDSSMTKNGHY